MGLDKFSAALDLLTGFNVNLYVGEEVFKGKLIGVEADHVVLETENKYIFYYNIDKIQAITKNTRQFKPETTTAKFQKTQSLTDLLHSFQNSWVTMLCINKQSFSGVLSDIDTDFVTLISGEERVLIKLTHISNILKGFIKEEVSKPKAPSEKAKNKEDSTDKSDTNGQAAVSSQKNENKTESISEPAPKEVSTSQEQEDNSSIPAEGSEKNEVAAAIEDNIEPNNTLVWSQPIKTEIPAVQTTEEVPLNNNNNQKPQAAEDPAVKVSADVKKKYKEASSKDKKMEEPKKSKSKQSDPPKEMKPVKETTSIVTTENKPAPPLQLQKKEVKSVKSKETATAAKPVTSQNQAHKKTENTKTNEPNTNSVWKQKDQETRAFRFLGEPVPQDSKRAFPFAGWPNPNNRTFRF